MKHRHKKSPRTLAGAGAQVERQTGEGLLGEIDFMLPVCIWIIEEV